MLILNIEGSNRVQLVRLDDETNPSYIESYVSAVHRYIDPAIDPAPVLRWCMVDVTSVAEHGPNGIAEMLTSEETLTDLPQEWQTVGLV